MAGITPQLSIVVEQHGQRTIVRLAGELDIVTAPELENALRSANSEIIVDLADLTFVDASGLRVLASAGTREERRGDRLVVVNANPLAQRMFELTGLDHLLSGSDAL
jgi:anti-sigma B factor antagonist